MGTAVGRVMRGHATTWRIGTSRRTASRHHQKRPARPMPAGGASRPSVYHANPMQILIVDDEPKIARLVRDYLERGGFGVSIARDGPEALMRARTEHPDLVVLDLGLPGLDGLDVARALRRDSSVPIIMLTARDDETDKVIGLELGADDYVTKPFS